MQMTVSEQEQAFKLQKFEINAESKLFSGAWTHRAEKGKANLTSMRLFLSMM